MPRGQKRRAPAPENDPESASESESRQPPRRRQRESPESDVQPDVVPEDDEDAYGDEFSTQGTNTQQLARKFVRYALSSEYSRQPIRRADVVAKVFPKDQARAFKNVFIEAQNQLREVFGMEMVELPARDKVTLQQKRAAQNKDKASTITKSWVLSSTLPPKYRHPEIIPPPQIPTTDNEASYVGLYTFIISCIYLHGGSLPESKLDRYLRRVNADHYTPVDKKDKLLQRLIKEQYIVKIRDGSSGEELIEYMVGPRGKVEIGVEGVAGLVRTVYGGSVDDLEVRLDRSLGITAEREAAKAATNGNAELPADEERTEGRRTGRRGRPRRAEQGDEESDFDG